MAIKSILTAGAAKSGLLTLLLVSIAFMGPMVAYAAVTVVWPDSTNTVDVDESPLVTFAAGADHSQSSTLGFAGAFTAGNNGASYTLALNGISGGTVTVDKLLNITKDAAVSSYKLQVGTALTGIDPTTLKFRLWTGATAPTADGSAGVCAVLDLESVALTETTASCSGASVFVQVVYQLPSGQTTQSGTVTVRPSSIVFA